MEWSPPATQHNEPSVKGMLPLRAGNQITPPERAPASQSSEQNVNRDIYRQTDWPSLTLGLCCGNINNLFGFHEEKIPSVSSTLTLKPARNRPELSPR